MTKTTEPVLEAMLHYWGGRCPDFDDTCPQCQAWAAYDTRPAPSQPVQPVAWLKEWTNQPDGEQYRRVDLRAESEDWLEHRKPTITPLYTHPAPSPDVAGLVERLREMGEHPCRSELPMGADLREAATTLATLSAENERLTARVAELEAALRALVRRQPAFAHMFERAIGSFEWAIALIDGCEPKPKGLVKSLRHWFDNSAKNAKKDADMIAVHDAWVAARAALETKHERSG